MNQLKTYISLFSSAGVGCYGFKEAGFECIATNELVSRRLDIQRYNKKCKYDSGYIYGDVTSPHTKALIKAEVSKWEKKEGLSEVDVIIATPPCQGMSVANHKKTSTEIVRNSLVIESIKMIKDFLPRVFIFENVPAFMKTVCTDIDGVNKSISEAIQNNLGSLYSYAARVINFKDYGACSSRSRNLVIGVRRDLADEVSPYELFPNRNKEVTLCEVIGKMKPLNTIGEIDANDIYHAFRAYPEHMRSWIHDLKEGESAFDNEDPQKRPHQIKNGVMVENQRKNGDKYRRQYWDKTGPCVHTRNDQLASQNTVHPSDDRVFSIRELMLMMTIPYSFKWSEMDLSELNAMPEHEKQQYLKKQEIRIRQSLGEAVPTEIFYGIATNIRRCLCRRFLTQKDLKVILDSESFSSYDSSISFIKENRDGWSLSSLMRIAELANTKRTENAAYYTNKSIITEILNRLPDKNADYIRILEPSVGVGNFVPLLIKRFDAKRVVIDVVDIDDLSLSVLRELLSQIEIPESVTINFISSDFLRYDFSSHYDYVVGNPPFGKLPSIDKMLKQYRSAAINKDTTNVCSFFLDKCVEVGDTVALVLPKAVLNIPEFKTSRDYLKKMQIEAILDFGENGFKGVLVETIALVINKAAKPAITNVYSMTSNKDTLLHQSYITDSNLPYWIIYRDVFFDRIAEKLRFDCFTVFRDRQITNGLLSQAGEIRVLKSRNIDDSGSHILSLPGYDAYINHDIAKHLAVYRFLSSKDVYITPNMTYKPRVMKKPDNTLVNGSVAILFPKENVTPTDAQLKYFSSDEYRKFYQIARNYQTRSLNVDSCSVYFFGLLREEKKA